MEDISLNYGAIRDSILRLVSSEIIKENDSKTLKKYSGCLKNNLLLYKQHLLYKNIENCKPFKKERLAERFIQQNLRLFADSNWRNILEENRTLRLSFLSNSHVEANKEKNDLFNNINTLLEAITTPEYKNIGKEQNAYEFILEYLTRRVSQESQESQEKTDYPNLKNWEYITKIAVNNFNDRYNHLNEEEQKIFEVLISDQKTKKDYLENLQKENFEIIDDMLAKNPDDEKRKLLEGFKNKMNNNTSINDEAILSYIELRDTLISETEK